MRKHGPLRPRRWQGRRRAWTHAVQHLRPDQRPRQDLEHHDLDAPRRQALALHAGTQLPLVVAIAAIAGQAGVMPPWQAASLVGGGVLTILVHPTLGLRRLMR